jgi:protein MAK11
LAAAEDNTISITKTRDWTVVSTVRAPRPKAQGRPNGDTAPPGGSPSGINDFAVHPSMKLMLSVGKSEKCIRLWNLVTGRKAGVLSFSKEILQSVKEGKRGTGEARRIVWNSQGEEFAVSFEWGVVVFGTVN